MDKDQSCPNLSTFSKSKDNILLDMSVTSSNELNIYLRYLENNKQFHLSLTEETLRTDEKLGKYFGSIDDLFDEIVENFGQLVMVPEGHISFDIQIGKTKKKTIELVTQIVENDPNKDIAALKKEIQILKQSHKSMQDRVNQFQDQTKDLRQIIVTQNKTIEQLNNRLENFEQIIKRFQLKRIDKRKESISSSQSQSQNYLKKDIQHISNGIIEIKQFWPHPKHPNNKYFSVKKGHRVITRINDNSLSELFILNSNLKDKEVYSMTVQLIKTRKGYMNISVLSDEVFRKCNAIKFNENISYDVGSEQIWAGGHLVKITKRQTLTIGQSIRITINRKNNVVEWHTIHEDGRVLLIGHAEIPQELVQQRYLYPAISMFHEGDTVRIPS